MTECDEILSELQEMLLGFQADLGGLSGDIRNLQQMSYDLGIQLGNRRMVERGLRGYLERIVVSPSLDGWRRRCWIERYGVIWRDCPFSSVSIHSQHFHYDCYHWIFDICPDFSLGMTK